MSEQWTGRPAARRQVVGDQRIQRVPVLPADGIELGWQRSKHADDPGTRPTFVPYRSSSKRTRGRAPAARRRYRRLSPGDAGPLGRPQLRGAYQAIRRSARSKMRMSRLAICTISAASTTSS